MTPTHDNFTDYILGSLTQGDVQLADAWQWKMPHSGPNESNFEMQRAAEFAKCNGFAGASWT